MVHLFWYVHSMPTQPAPGPLRLYIIRRNPGSLLRRTLQLHGNWHTRRICHLAPRYIKELILFQILKYYNLTWLRRFFMPRPVSGARARNISRVVDTVTRRIERRTNRKNFLHYILAAMQSDKGMTRDEIKVNAFSFSIAGSEATATALAAFVFYICTHPRVYRTVVAEIRSAFTDEGQIGMSTVNDLTYLNAVLNEVLRMHPPVAIALPRMVPCAGVFIDGRFVPQGTSVGVNHFLTYRDPCNFYRPDGFVPERWLPDRTVEIETDCRDAFHPFSVGPRNCLGRNLAWAEMRMVAVRLLFRFDLSLVCCERWDDQMIWGFWVKKGRCGWRCLGLLVKRSDLTCQLFSTVF